MSYDYDLVDWAGAATSYVKGQCLATLEAFADETFTNAFDGTPNPPVSGSLPFHKAWEAMAA